MKRKMLLTVGVLLTAAALASGREPDADTDIELLVTPPLAVKPQPAFPLIQTVNDGLPARGPGATNVSLPPAMSSSTAAAEGTLASPSLLPPAGGAEPLHHGLVAGASLLLVKPYVENNTAYATFSGIGTPSPQRTEVSFDWSYDATPEFWLGWVTSSGWGARARYFFFDQSSNTRTASLGPFPPGSAITSPPGLALTGPVASSAGLPLPATVAPAFGSPGIILGAGLGEDRLTFTSDLRLNVLDLDVTYDVQLCGFELEVAGGARYLHAVQDYAASVRNSVTFAPGVAASESQLLMLQRRFVGAGPTVALAANRALGQGGLSAYGSIRGSLLVGSRTDDLTFSQVVVDPTGMVGGPQNNRPTATGTQDQPLTTAEVELGLEYTYHGSWLRPFARVGAVDQTYFHLGSATRDDGNLTLFGVQFSAGVGF